MTEFRMPSLGADMDVGTIVDWLVKPGDVVRRGQIVAVVDTAKAAIEIEAFTSGVLSEILVPPGIQVPVGTPLALIEDAAAQPSVGGLATGGTPAQVGTSAPPVGTAAPSGTGSPVPEAGPRATPPVRHLAHQLGVAIEQVEPTGRGGRVTHDDVVRAARRSSREPATAVPEPQAPPAQATPGPRRPWATPRARRLAAEHGIDLATVVGSGQAGAVLAADVERSAARALVTQPPEVGSGPPPAQAAVATPARSAPAGGVDRTQAMRSAIASLMSRANAEIPHYWVSRTLDLGPALTWVRGHNADLPVRQRILPAVLFLRATALAAIAVPDLNGHWVDDRLQRAPRVDLGVAIATRGGGLVTPAIPDAGGLGIDELMARLADLASRARRGSLRQSEMAGASITVSALGEDGADALLGVIFPPQVALVGVGGIVERPWAVEGMLTVRPTVTVTIAADHRATDGRTASAFLAAFARALDHPEEL